MQKKRVIIIAVSLMVLFSLFRLCNLEISHESEIQKTSVMRFRFLIGVHGLFLFALGGLFFLHDFQQYLMVAFLFFGSVTISFLVCESMVGGMPGHKQDDDYLVFREDNFKRTREKTYLSVYYLVYMYSIIGSIMLGLFLLIRFLVVKWYERLLEIELERAVTPINYSDDFKGKQCTICMSQLAQHAQELCELNNCHHTFHENCIKAWVHYSRTCPLCRGNIFPQRRSNQDLSL